jgi:selenocysteine lyase/cysteine desulfurase
MAIDLLQARRDTPGCEKTLHFNNASAGLAPVQVLDALVSHLQLEAQIGSLEAAGRRRDAVEGVYDSVANLINCDREEIAIVENATRAWDMAFYSLPLGPGDRILTAKAEYASNYIAFLQVASRTGAEIGVIPDDEHGQVSIAALQGAIDERVKLISITHVPTNGGLVNPAAAVGEIAREAGVLYLLDACQSVGQMPIDVKTIGCDMLSATGRKFLRGPRGTGFLFVRRDLIGAMEPPMLDLHAAKWTSSGTYEIRRDARRFENWETNYASKLGLGVAVDYALLWGLDSIWERVSALGRGLRERLGKIPGVTVRDIGAEKCGIVTFTADSTNPATIRQGLAKHSINVSVSPANWTLLDMEARGLAELVRASVHYYNSEKEIERFCSVLEGML